MRIQVKSEWKKTLCSSMGIAQIAQAILDHEDELDRDKEHIWCFGLNSSNIIKYIDLVHLGTATTCCLHPREVFRLAVMKGAIGIILVHNHTGGNPSPSLDDKIITKRLVKAGEVLGIKVLDHVIISGGKFFSFADHDLL